MIASIKKYWHPITLSMVFFTTWLWSFPMFGPLYGLLDIDYQQLFLSFLISHAFGLFIYAFYAEKIKQILKCNARQFIKYSSIILGILTIIFPYLANSFFLPLMALIGLISGPLVINYLYHLGGKAWYNYRGRILGLIFFLASALSLIFMFVSAAEWMYILTGSFLFIPLTLEKSIFIKKVEVPEIDLANFKRSYWFALIILLVLFYAGGGLMYSLSYGDILASEDNYFDLGFIFYLLTVIPAGSMADKKGRLYLINFGLSFSGIGFLLLLLSDNSLLQSLSLGLLQSAFAVMDLYIFLTLIDWSNFFRSKKIIGIGLAINVIAVFISSWPFLGNQVDSLIANNYIPLLGIVFIMLIIPILIFLKDTFPLYPKQTNNIKQGREEIYQEFSLTEREQEVANLLLAGYKTKEITDKLCISYNTLKTHLKNLYKKTESNGQTDFILLIWKKTN